MQKLFDLSKKAAKNVIGIMSGTSVDAVDLALTEISGNGCDTQVKLRAYLEYPFPKEIRQLILRNSSVNTARIDDICRLNFLIPRLYCEGIRELCRQSGISLEEVDLIGSHGQTIHHLPSAEDISGFDTRSTLQIGDPMVIAKLTGAVTVGDFRTGDIAAGGQGAPLVPYFDYMVFRSMTKNRALLNIGGISNITLLKKRGTPEQVRAFDTGPGNMMIDILVKKYFGKEYDENGSIALSGSIDNDLLRSMIKKDNYIEQKPPKSTGREYYGEGFLDDVLHREHTASPEPRTVIATAAEFTAYAVYRNYEKFIMPGTQIDELIVSGGGARNRFLMERLKSYFGGGVNIYPADHLGIPSDAKEAVCFACLANETISGNPANVPQVTGANRATILGKICLP